MDWQLRLPDTEGVALQDLGTDVRLCLGNYSSSTNLVRILGAFDFPNAYF